MITFSESASMPDRLLLAAAFPGIMERCAAIMHQAKNLSDVAERFAALTERQQQVATLVCAKLSNKTIAQKLGVSEGTAKAHLHAIYEKLHVQSRMEIIITSRIVQNRRPTD